jgi:hypothetical protein
MRRVLRGTLGLLSTSRHATGQSTLFSVRSYIRTHPPAGTDAKAKSCESLDLVQLKWELQKLPPASSAQATIALISWSWLLIFDRGKDDMHSSVGLDYWSLYAPVF